MGVKGTTLWTSLLLYLFSGFQGKELRSESGFLSKCFAHRAILLALHASFVWLLASCDSGATVTLKILSVQ